MILANEPGYYSEGDFGLRIESHMVTVPAAEPGFLRFETISRLPIDPRLLDFGRLTVAETDWLKRYHLRVLQDLGPLLAQQDHEWLRRRLAPFFKAGHSAPPQG